MLAEQAGDPEVQDAHMLVQCASDPERMWVQHHNGIFRSDDCGLQWTELLDVNPSSFGFAVAVHPWQPDTAWFVPGIRDGKRYPVAGGLVVARTRDAGKSFDV